ncbi:hypothetical protein F5J12DRAFT_796602 [Pisolithus orientalis]|uniref:uncharacterized protein n=1 Tax=Pisolithus orientalis TaxID=936130 RepID=UPI0022253D83|nr:uncharacterized protein F5J12DRAFT_796602 [Pisolithus orientalis]KAI6032810.1 hypothetical protein F5J12DRAFT_796602 [Pisolithus orientalis]
MLRRLFHIFVAWNKTAAVGPSHQAWVHTCQEKTKNEAYVKTQKSRSSNQVPDILRVKVSRKVVKVDPRTSVTRRCPAPVGYGGTYSRREQRREME